MKLDFTMYTELVKSYLDGLISEPEFSELFVMEFKNDHRIFTEEVYEVLNRVFSDIDLLCHDIQGIEMVDENILRSDCQIALDALKKNSI